MKSRVPLAISATVVAAMLAASAWAWFHLPAGARIAIHWDVYGQPNGFVQGPFAVFITPAMTALIALFFAAIPVLEPRRVNLARSAKFYHAAWIGTILLLGAVHGLALFSALHEGTQVGSLIIAAVCLLMIVTGNYLGKTRSMFLGGVRTPWTLLSEYSWQRTHSLAGKLFIAAGVLGFVAVVALPLKAAVEIFVYAIAAAVVLSVVVSYFYWLCDPERRHTSQ